MWRQEMMICGVEKWDTNLEYVFVAYWACFYDSTYIGWCRVNIFFIASL